MKNLFLEKTKKGEKTIGTFLEMGVSTVAETLARSNLDYILIDSEHGPFGVESTMDMIRNIELHNCTPFVRVSDSSRTAILKMLDIGAKGIIIPQVHSIQEIYKIVEYGKYFPVGQRGVALSRGAGFGYAEHAKGNINSYFEICNKETLLIPQCETLGCLEEIEEIAKVEGIDGIFVGPYDLSVAMGMPTEFDNPKFIAAIDRILKAVKDAGKFAIIYCADAPLATKRLKQGFDSVTVGQDANFYVDAVNQMISDIEK